MNAGYTITIQCHRLSQIHGSTEWQTRVWHTSKADDTNQPSYNGARSVQRGRGMRKGPVIAGSTSDRSYLKCYQQQYVHPDDKFAATLMPPQIRPSWKHAARETWVISSRQKGKHYARIGDWFKCLWLRTSQMIVRSIKAEWVRQSTVGQCGSKGWWGWGSSDR